MAGTPSSNNRIVPVIAGKKPVPASSRGSGPRPLRQQLLKGEPVDTDALKIQCLEELRLYAAPIKGDGECPTLNLLAPVSSGVLTFIYSVLNRNKKP